MPSTTTWCCPPPEVAVRPQPQGGMQREPRGWRQCRSDRLPTGGRDAAGRSARRGAHGPQPAPGRSVLHGGQQLPPPRRRAAAARRVRPLRLRRLQTPARSTQLRRRRGVRDLRPEPRKSGRRPSYPLAPAEPGTQFLRARIPETMPAEFFASVWLAGERTRFDFYFEEPSRELTQAELAALRRGSVRTAISVRRSRCPRAAREVVAEIERRTELLRQLIERGDWLALHIPAFDVIDLGEALLDQLDGSAAARSGSGAPGDRAHAPERGRDRPRRRRRRLRPGAARVRALRGGGEDGGRSLPRARRRHADLG